MAGFFHEILARAAAFGAAGCAGFVLIYAVACVTFLPVSILTLSAGAAFGLWRGFLLVWMGAVLGACLSFLIGRHWLRGWVGRRMTGVPSFAAIDAAVSQQGWRVVLLTRLSPLLPFGLLNYAYGLTKIGFGEYALATALGIIPGTLLFVYLGAVAGETAGARGRSRSPLEWGFFIGGLAATLAAAWLIGRAARKALAKTTA